MKREFPSNRVPIDCAPILSASHVPLLQDSPLSELAEAMKHHSRLELKADPNFLRLIRRGVNATTTHLSTDYAQLCTFNEDWGSGRYFSTERGKQNLVSRASTMWTEAGRYLQISSILNKARFEGSEKGLTDEKWTSALAQGTLDISTRVLKQFVKSDRPSR